MEENLRIARSLVFKFNELVQAQDIDGILDALSAEATIQVPEYTPITGKDTIREFYETRFHTKGSYRFDLALTDEREMSGLCFINGTMRRMIDRADKPQEVSELSFSFILRREDGALKIWQIRVV